MKTSLTRGLSWREICFRPACSCNDFITLVTNEFNPFSFSLDSKLPLLIRLWSIKTYILASSTLAIESIRLILFEISPFLTVSRRAFANCIMYFRGISVSFVTDSVILVWRSTFDLSMLICLRDVMFLSRRMPHSLFSKLIIRRST